MRRTQARLPLLLILLPLLAAPPASAQDAGPTPADAGARIPDDDEPDDDEEDAASDAGPEAAEEADVRDGDDADDDDDDGDAEDAAPATAAPTATTTTNNAPSGAPPNEPVEDEPPAEAPPEPAGGEAPPADAPPKEPAPSGKLSREDVEELERLVEEGDFENHARGLWGGGVGVHFAPVLVGPIGNASAPTNFWPQPTDHWRVNGTPGSLGLGFTLDGVGVSSLGFLAMCATEAVMADSADCPTAGNVFFGGGYHPLLYARGYPVVTIEDFAVGAGLGFSLAPSAATVGGRTRGFLGVTPTLELMASFSGIHNVLIALNVGGGPELPLQNVGLPSLFGLSQTAGLALNGELDLYWIPLKWGGIYTRLGSHVLVPAFGTTDLKVAPILGAGVILTSDFWSLRW